MPNKNPEHAAVRSNATTLVESHPTAWAILGASPNKSSGEDVAQITKSMEEASMPDIASACRAASMPRVRSVSGTSSFSDSPAVLEVVESSTLRVPS